MPLPGPGEVLVKLSHSGVCHSDLHAMLGEWPWLKISDGQVGGHEGKRKRRKDLIYMLCMLGGLEIADGHEGVG